MPRDGYLAFVVVAPPPPAGGVECALCHDLPAAGRDAEADGLEPWCHECARAHEPDATSWDDHDEAWIRDLIIATEGAP